MILKWRTHRRSHPNWLSASDCHSNGNWIYSFCHFASEVLMADAVDGEERWIIYNCIWRETKHRHLSRYALGQLFGAIKRVNNWSNIHWNDIRNGGLEEFLHVFFAVISIISIETRRSSCLNSVRCSPFTKQWDIETPYAIGIASIGRISTGGIPTVDMVGFAWWQKTPSVRFGPDQMEPLKWNDFSLKILRFPESFGGFARSQLNFFRNRSLHPTKWSEIK